MDSKRAMGRWWGSARAKALVSALAALCLAAPVLAAGISAASSPQVVFDTAGLKTVTLSVCNANLQCSLATKTVEVLDPTPVITTSVVMIPTVEAPAPVPLYAEGIGKPGLTFRWHVKRKFACTEAAVEVATVTGDYVFWSTAGAPAGDYAAVLDLTNGNGATVSSDELPFTVADPAKLLEDGFEGPCSTPWTFAAGDPLS